MNRTLPSAGALALIFLTVASCSDTSITGPDGPSSDDLTAEANRVIGSIQVTLGASSLAVGKTTQASVVILDRQGRPLNRSVEWSSTDAAIATVDATGLITALSPGVVSIVATHRLKSGSAQLTVVPADTGTTPPSGAFNEPAGTYLISDRGFGALNEDRLWTDEIPATIATDASAPRSPSKIWRAVYPAGFRGGRGPAGSWLEFSNRPHTAYIRWYFKYSSNWYGHPSEVNKMFYVWTNASVPSIVIIAKGIGTAPLTFRIGGQDIVRGGEGHGDASNPDWDPNLVPAARISRGEWHVGEVLLVGNTTGAANGSIDGWIDGVHVTSYSGIQFRSGNVVWGDVNLAPVWGGLGGTVPAIQTFDVDHFYMSGKQ